MLDVHILTMPDTRRDWQDQCIASVELAASLADYPVHVHVMPGVPGHIGRARANGYAAGSAPWKTYVDEDDYVRPNAFKVLGAHFDSDAVAICPRESVEQNGRLHGFTVGRHHLIAYRADFITAFPHADWVCMGDVMATVQANKAPGGVLDIEDALYVHRVYYASRARNLRRANRHEAGMVREAA